MRTRHLSPTTADRFFAPAVITAPKLLALLAAIWWLALAHSALQAADVVVPRAIQAIVDSPDRSDADRGTDQRRQSVKLLAFFGVKPEMAVLDMGTGGGYTTELLARAVGSRGSVVAQNDTFIFEKYLKETPDPRFRTSVMKNVKHVARPYDDPIPPGAGPFDLITSIFVYHDTEWLGRDRQEMNKKYFNSLKPGGHIVIVDHAGNLGSGASQSQTLHRIEESVVRSELEAAGFELVGEAQFLRNPDDPGDKSFREASVPVDQFVIKYRKPVR